MWFAIVCVDVPELRLQRLQVWLVGRCREHVLLLQKLISLGWAPDKHPLPHVAVYHDTLVEAVLEREVSYLSIISFAVSDSVWEKSRNRIKVASDSRSERRSNFSFSLV